MKNRVNKLITVLAALLLVVTSCEWEPIMWDDSKIFVAFSAATSIVPEEGGAMPIVVAVTALEGAPSVTVSFDFDTVGIDPANAAVLETNFSLVNSEKTLSFPDGYGYDTIWIQPVDNDYFTGDKYFNITLTTNSQSYEFGAMNTNTVTLKDNEHPLNIVLGSYLETDYYFTDGSVDGTYNVSVAPDPDDITKVFISNIWGGGETIAASVDLEANTITISSEEVIYISGSYGDCKMVLLDDDYAYIDGDIVCPIIDDAGNWETPKWAAVVSAGWFGKYQKSTFERQ